MSLTTGELDTIAIAGRVSSSLSLLGSAAIITAFTCSRYFRSPIHRIIFYNAFYNLFDSVATMISTSGPIAGDTSALCQFQGFVLQMFPIADVLWTFAMALDTYLVVIHHFESHYLHRLEPLYIAMITGVTFIPALVFLFIRSPEKGPIYGSETIWCSISHEWMILRIVLYYAPVWILIGVVLMFYFLIGFQILKLRDDFKLTDDDHIALTSVGSNPPPAHYSGSTADISVRGDLSGKSSPIVTSSFGTETSVQALPSQPAPRSPAAAYRHQSQRRVSFKQYIIMPSLFFLALLATWVTPTINRVAAFIHPGHESYALLLAVSTLGSLRGFWNGIIFVTIGMKGWRRIKEARGAVSHRV